MSVCVEIRWALGTSESAKSLVESPSSSLDSSSLLVLLSAYFAEANSLILDLNSSLTGSLFSPLDCCASSFSCEVKKKERKKLKYECARWLVSHLQYIKKCCTQVITTSSFLTGFCFSFSNVSVCFLSFCLYWRRINTKLKCTRFHIHTLIWNSYWRLQNLPVS